MAAETVSRKDPRTSLNELDCSAQNLAAEVEAVCKAAQLALLSRDPGAAKAVYTMLGIISDAVLTHENYVNAEAEEHGCNWIDEDERKVMRTLEAAPFAVEVSHG